MPRDAVPAHDPDPADVNFVVGSVDAGMDEELAQPSERRRILLPLIVGAAFLALVVVALAGRHPTAHPTAAPTVPPPTGTALPKAPLDISDVRLNPITGEIIDVHNGRVIGQAPTRLGSTTSMARPAAVSAALRDAFADVRAIRVESDISQTDGRLLERQITARGGGFDLLVHVEPARHHVEPQVRIRFLASGTSVSVRNRTSGSLISVRATSTRGVKADFTVLNGLADDRRLLSPG